MPDAVHYLAVAFILRPHGVRGDMRVQILTDYPERLIHLPQVFVGREQRPTDTDVTAYKVTYASPDKGNRWFIHLKGIDSREQADVLREKYIFVALVDAVPLEADELYLFQVIGLAVFDETGERLGQVADIMQTGANEVLIVRGEVYGELLIPLIDGVLQQIDLEKQALLVHLPAGLLDKPIQDD